jgi:Outer membrane protein beta-barrel domain
MTHRTYTTLGRRLWLGILTAGLITATSATAQAQAFISPMFGVDFSGDTGCPNIDSCEDKKANISVSAGILGRLAGLEAEFAYAPDFFGSGPGFSSSVATFMVNVMVAPKIGPVRPYALVGAGLIKSHVEFTAASLLTTDNNDFGWDLGGGLMVHLSDHFGLRGDLRYFHAFRDFEALGFTLDNAKLDYGRASGGLVITF